MLCGDKYIYNIINNVNHNNNNNNNIIIKKEEIKEIEEKKINDLNDIKKNINKEDYSIEDYKFLKFRISSCPSISEESNLSNLSIIYEIIDEIIDEI